MPEYTLNRNDDAVQLFRGTLKGNGINPLFFARDIKTSLSVGGENDLDAALIDLAAKVADHTAEGSIRSELLQLAEFNRYRGDWKAAAYRVNDEIFSTDNHFYVRLTAGTDTSSDTAPTATTAEWRKVANGTLEDEIITFHKRIQEDHKIFVDDWGTHAVGTEYKVGDIVKRYVQWFICEEPHVKGAVGPDNDADRWSPITNFAGDYDGTRWYHAGVYVIYNNRITHALEDITPSDPAPDHADNTKWEWNAASSSGGFNTEWTNANAINLTAFGDLEFASGNLTELVVGKPNLIAFDGNATLTDGDSLSRGNNVRVQIQINGGEWVDLTPQININGETNAAHVIRTAAAVAIWPTTETEPFKLRFHSNRAGTTGTLAAGARLLQEEAIGTVDLGTIYHTNEEIIKGGAGIHVTADDDAETLTVNSLTFNPWRYEEPSGGLPDLEIDSQNANSGVVEHITGTVDADSALVYAIRGAQAAGVSTTLHVAATLKYFLKQDPPLVNTSGAILTVETWLGVNRPGADKYLTRLDTNDPTLADFRNSNGGRDAYGANEDINKHISLEFTDEDFAEWDLQEGETLTLILHGGNVNGSASVKLEIDNEVLSFDRSTEAIDRLTEEVNALSEPLRYRAVVSSDVRTTTEKYQIEYGGNSYTVQHSAQRINTFTPAHPSLPDGYDATKVNLVYDGGDHQFNPSGDTDFTAESAGTTTRLMKCTLEIAPDPSQERSNNDVLNLVIHAGGRARVNGAASVNKRLAFANSQTYPFLVHFNLTYINTPRGGTADPVWFTLQSDISRIKVIPKLTYFLPFTGAALPTQTYDQPGTSGHVVLGSLTANEHDEIVPEELIRPLAGGRMALWEIPSGSTNNEGRNDPTEEDHSDSMRAALGSHGNVFIEAAQDLSQLHLTLKQKAAVATGQSYEVYLCTYLRGVLKPVVVAHTSLFSGPPQWTIDYIGKGILRGQRFYMLSRGVIGDAEMIWDATIQDAVRNVTVKPGFTTSREVVLGSAANTFTLGNIVNLPPVETWVKLRFFSSGLITTLDWPENYIEGFPTNAGQPSLTHPALGPLSAHQTDATGTIVHNRYIVPWRDSPDWKFSIYNGSSLNSLWIDRVEIEYELLN